MGVIERRYRQPRERVQRANDTTQWAQRNAAALAWCPGVGALVEVLGPDVVCPECGRRFVAPRRAGRVTVYRHKVRRG